MPLDEKLFPDEEKVRGEVLQPITEERSESMCRVEKRAKRHELERS